MYEHSDVIQWGLQLLDGEPSYNPGYYGEVIQHDTGDVYNGHYFQSLYDNESNHVENDEIIARTLQEEFSQLEIAKCSGYSQAGEEQFHASEPSYDWHSSSMMSYNPGDHQYLHGGVDNVEHSSICSSPGDREDYSLDLTSDYSPDYEVGRRFSQMIPIPHVPRINREIPSIDEATSDHQRLLDSDTNHVLLSAWKEACVNYGFHCTLPLQLYDFVEQKVQGDGNCQFRALSDQIYGSPEHHNFVRQQVVNQLKSHPEIYEGYVPMAYDEYLEKMSKNGEWGDHVTLQAAADSYGLKIFMITSFKDTCYIEILPHSDKPKRGIFLSFWAEVHYNSIYPQGDIASTELRKKKRWWNFGSKH